MSVSTQHHQLLPADLSRIRRAVVATSIGNALEWFDIIVYAFFAVPISKNFFPEQSKQGALGLILTFLTFFLSYLIRPLGAMVIGNYGDRAGRKAAMTLTIALMTLGLLLMGFAPPVSVIGAAAPLVLMLARLLQGFSAGGEFGSSTAFLTENATERTSYYASWQVASQGIAMFLAAGFGALLNTTLSSTALQTWGWRVPFIFGLLIAPVGWYIRQHMEDTAEFEHATHEKSPLWTTFRHHFGRVLVAAGCVGTATTSVYFLSYMPSFAMTHLHLPSRSGYLGSFISGVLMFVASPFVGRLADRVGRIPIMLPAAVAGLIVIYPMFAALVRRPSVLTLTLVQIALGCVMVAYFAPLPSLLSNMFPVQIRTTGMSLAYNIGVALLGGLAPVAMEWLISVTHSDLAPSGWYMLVAVISVVGLILARGIYRQR